MAQLLAVSPEEGDVLMMIDYLPATVRMTVVWAVVIVLNILDQNMNGEKESEQT